MSTYSPSLRVELITSGDQAGQWGNTTNDNFAYIFDAAIAGYQTVSVTSASQAFTYNNGPLSTASLNQSVYAMLRLTTTTAAAFSVYAPPNSKQYIIWNDSGYAATIYNSATIGGTTPPVAPNGIGVTIAAGDKVLVWSDGANFYNIKSDGITGIVSGANGGTGVNNSGKTITLGGNLTTAGAFNTTLTSSGATNVTLPTTGTLATLTGGEVLTNKTISGASNTLSNIANASLTNSAITINGSNVSLGGSITVTATASNALTIGTGLSGGSYNGSSAVTIAIDSTVATLSGNQALTNKTISGSNNTLQNIDNSSLTNSSITVNSTAISLGSSATITAVNPNALTIGTGLSGTSYNGSGAVTIALATGYGDTQNPYASKTANFVLAAPNGSSGAPTFRAIVAADIPTLNQNTTGTAAGLSSTLVISSGGTNSTATPTAGGISYGTGSAYAFTSAGTSGQVLTSNGAGAPTWSSVGASVSSISFGTTGLTPSTATSGVVTVAGTLGTGNGGTGLTSYTSNGVLYASGASTLASGSNFVFDGTNVGIGESSPSTYGKFVVGGTGSFTSSLVSTSSTTTDRPLLEIRKTRNNTTNQVNTVGAISFNGKWGSTAGEQGFIDLVSTNASGIVDSNVLTLGVKSIFAGGNIKGNIQIGNSTVYINSGNGGEISIVNAAMTYDGSSHYFDGPVTMSSALPVGSGGTGATSFTSGALLKGNGSGAIQVASAADIVGQIGSTAVTNATNATNAGNATTVTNGVYTTGNQTIGGTKTFTNGITFNDTSAQTSAAPTGVWNNLTSSRATDTLYTNNYGRAIFLSISGVLNPASTTDIQVSGVTIAQFGTASSQARGQLYAIVPRGATYQLATTGGSALTLSQWFEYY